MEPSRTGILDRILKDATKEAENILRNANHFAESIVEKQRKSAFQNAKNEASSILKKAKNEADVIRGKVTTEIKRQANWKVLSEKNLLITKVLDEVKNKLLKLRKEKYITVIEKLIVEAGTVLGGGILELFLGEIEPNSVNLSKLERKISDSSGNKTELRISEHGIKTRGVIVKTVDSQISVNNTFEAILHRRKKELKLKISRILFNSNVELDLTLRKGSFGTSPAEEQI